MQKPSLATRTTTHLIILGANALPRAAWVALLQKQPRITVVTAVATIADLPTPLPPQQPTTIFVDVPTLNHDFVTRVATVYAEAVEVSVPNHGFLFLIETYQIKEMVTLLQAGATGFIARDATVPDLARAIIAVGRGEIVLPPTLASQVMVALARGNVAEKRPLTTLTTREKEVLTLLAHGLTNKEIAQTLILSVRTVEAHLRNIYGKLHVASRTEAALWAVTHNFHSKQQQT